MGKPLTIQEAQVARKYMENVPVNADPVMVDLDTEIIKNMPTWDWENLSALAQAQQNEAEHARQQELERQSLGADKAMDDLDNALRRNFEDQFPLSVGESSKLPAGVVKPDDVLGPEAESRRIDAEIRRRIAATEGRQEIANEFNRRGRR